MDNLANAFPNGRNKYPKTAVAAYKLVTNRKSSTKPSPPQALAGMSFTQEGEKDDGGNSATGTFNANKTVLKRRDGTPVKCIVCSGNHWPNKCPQKKDEDRIATEKNKEKDKQKDATPDRNKEEEQSKVTTSHMLTITVSV